MALVLYRGADDTESLFEAELDARDHFSSPYWHVFVEGAKAGLYYTWRLYRNGEWISTELLDPWAREVSDAAWDRRKSIAAAGTRTAGTPPNRETLRGRVHATTPYDWQGDAPITRAVEDSIIYELHVKGFTRHASSGVASPGTFRGVIEKIPYLKAFGITDVELLPIMAFDRQDVAPGTAERGLGNYWGYSTFGFHALHPAYGSADTAREFKDMVRELHRAGIGVILDVVFNHTSEAGRAGPVIHFKGLDLATFYHVDSVHPPRFRDYTGCGNTVNCNHPFVVRFIVECLEYWVREFHIDGFRFDLASVFSRGTDGEPMSHPPLIHTIEASPVLAKTRLIAEAWDAVGLYQVGHFPGTRWMELNGPFRDTVRQFATGTPGLVRALATRISGNSDHHRDRNKGPGHSLNFVTCHDGFTLLDLVSYSAKDNMDNGENNFDGSDHDFSWNCGVEGPTDDVNVVTLRRRMVRNLTAILLVSQGVPMLLAGDERLRTQAGNNNAYCQDNAVSWIDWNADPGRDAMTRFTREMIALRKRHRALSRNTFLTGKPGTGRADRPDVSWHGSEIGKPRWDAADGRVLALTLAGQEDDEGDVHIMMNMTTAPVGMAVPEPPGQCWFRAVDTTLEPPGDILVPECQPRFEQDRYRVGPRSVVILESRPEAG
jgi:glycogen operon protein